MTPHARYPLAMLLVALALVGPATDAAAMWAPLTDAELTDQSDLIVVGELIGQTQVRLAPDQPRLAFGILRVDEALKGDRARRMVLLALPSPDAPRSSTDITHRPGEKGLWYLKGRAQAEGIYLADHPQRFVPANQATPRIDSLRKSLKNRP